MRTFTLVVLTAALTLLSVGCTRNVYIVQNPDGTYSEVPEFIEPEPPDHVVVMDPDGDDVLAVQVLTANDYVLIDAYEDVVYLEVEVVAEELELVERGPMNVALVIDRSGSMTGAKLENAKAAALSLIDDLAIGDRVALVTYASDVHIEFPSTVLDAGSRAMFEEVIMGLEAVGGTDLGGGLQEGARQVLEAYHPHDLNRVLLISDGRPTVGDSDPHRLERLAADWHGDGVSVTTMGIGEDYNEDLMTTLALAGGGNYYYVESPREMAAVFRQELRSFGRTVVRDVEVSLAVPRGVNVRQVYGYRHERRGDDVVIKMNSLASGQRRRLLLALDVPSSASGRDREGVISIASGRLTYRNEMTDAKREVAIPPVRVSYTRDRALVQRSFRRPVIEKLEAVRNAELRDRVMARLDAGDTEAARGLVRHRLTAARKVNNSVGGRALGREVADLEDLDRAVVSRPAPASPEYKRLRKSQKARAFEAMMD